MDGPEDASVTLRQPVIIFEDVLKYLSGGSSVPSANFLEILGPEAAMPHVSR